MTIEDLNLIGTIIISILGVILTMYKYLEHELEKKVDKILYEKEIEFLKNQINTNGTNIYYLLEKVKEELQLIKGHIIKERLDEEIGK